MAWRVYGFMNGHGEGTKRSPAVYGPLPRKLWVAIPGERKHRVKRGADSVAGRATVKEYTAERADLYARWLAQRDGLTVPDNCKGIAVWSSVIVPDKVRPEPRVCAVQFRKRANDYSLEVTGPVLLTINIPNWDWVPQMTDESSASVQICVDIHRASL